MRSLPSENPNCSRLWRFTWETLAHIPILRLYLFTPDILDTSSLSPSLHASLRLDLSLLLLSWNLHQEQTLNSAKSFLYIPIPTKVLIDPDCQVHVKAMADHIEVKLLLLLPVEADLWGGMEFDSHLPLSPDIERFSSQGVNIFCKSCSAKLTSRPLRNFVEIPSTNWQDVADNWFGGCCSFGGVSEKLVTKYLETIDFKEGTCLIDRVSVTVCEDDLEGAAFEKTTSDCEMKSSQSNNTSSMISDMNSAGQPDVVLSSNVYSNQPGLVGTQNDASMDCMKPSLNHFSPYDEKTFSEFTDERTSKFDFHCCITEKVQTSNHADGRIESEASTAASNARQALKVYGSGFMVAPANLSNDVECTELSCRHCSAPLGSYSFLRGATAPVVGSVRLFKCYISTSLPVGAPDDAFKNYNLENIFTNLLIEGARDDLSFRTVVCDLRTKFPMLQIVLLNSRAWCYHGSCYENAATTGRPAIHMQPVVKVLFSDCKPSTEGEISVISTNRSTWSGTEEVYMMSREIEELRRSLKSSIAKLPLSCSALQGMFLSFLAR